MASAVDLCLLLRDGRFDLGAALDERFDVVITPGTIGGDVHMSPLCPRTIALPTRGAGKSESLGIRDLADADLCVHCRSQRLGLDADTSGRLKVLSDFVWCESMCVADPGDIGSLIVLEDVLSSGSLSEDGRDRRLVKRVFERLLLNAWWGTGDELRVMVVDWIWSTSGVLETLRRRSSSSGMVGQTSFVGLREGVGSSAGVWGIEVVEPGELVDQTLLERMMSFYEVGASPLDAGEAAGLMARIDKSGHAQ